MAELRFEEIDDTTEVRAFRKYMITINNPSDHGFSRDSLIDIIERKHWDYACLSYEEGGESGTPHFHIFIYHNNNVAVKTIRSLFPKMHYDICRGKAQECRDYVFKDGKYKDSEKSLTSFPDSFYEWGECPFEAQGSRTDIVDIYEAIKNGKSNFEIIEHDPHALRHLELIQKARELLLFEQFKDKWRDVHVEYLWGKTGAGKTRLIYDTYGYAEVYRVTDYQHAFDKYAGQSVLMLDEFRNSFQISMLLTLLDGYPLQLPARYENKTACFDKVFIISNIPLHVQYKHIQEEEPETWKALLRRIDKVQYFGKDNSGYRLDPEQALQLQDDFEQLNLPFD